MEIELKGIPVNKVYYQGQEPKITNGNFEITNQSKGPIAVSVMEAHVSDGEKELPLDKYFLYKLPEYTELDPENFTVKEKQGFQLDLSFQFIPIAGLNKNNIVVNMTIKVTDDTVQASSPIVFDFRVPKIN
ncbi:hypothetical protein GCM10009119_21680 [Algoriphagus jejuensis]|uniref:Uncharacterized protein n=1 Tax=Algoriphagus jejuensis TaxID=419934 RepID=A0ABN1N0E5_9BACT